MARLTRPQSSLEIEISPASVNGFGRDGTAIITFAAIGTRSTAPQRAHHRPVQSRTSPVGEPCFAKLANILTTPSSHRSVGPASALVTSDTVIAGSDSTAVRLAKP